LAEMKRSRRWNERLIRRPMGARLQGKDRGSRAFGFAQKYTK
jgi:hypothetical protein